MTLKRTQVVMLSAYKKAIDRSAHTLWLNQIGQLLHTHSMSEDLIPQHLYFLSDDEIKEDDWFYNTFNDNQSKIQQKKGGWITCFNQHKIIATTDTSLRKHDDTVPYPKTKPALPQPSQDFIEVFVKEYNKSNVIELVDVEYDIMNKGYTKKTDYPYQECEILRVNLKNEITIRKIKDSWNREELFDLIHKAVSHFDNEFDHQLDNSLVKEWISENL